MKYIDRRDHGCKACSGLFGWDAVGRSEIPAVLVPAERALAGRAGSWTGWFRRCERCRAWWCVTWNPKDMIHEQTAVHASVQAALGRDATLDQAWPFLFAPAPVDEIFENYLYAGHFDPQAALDRLLDKLSSPKATPSNRYDIVRMLSRLLALRNPDHAQLQRRRGWVWRTPPDSTFRAPLLAFEKAVLTDQPDHRGFEPYARENMKALRWVLERDADGRQRVFRDGTPSLAWAH